MKKFTSNFLLAIFAFGVIIIAFSLLAGCESNSDTNIDGDLTESEISDGDEDAGEDAETLDGDSDQDLEGDDPLVDGTFSLLLNKEEREILLMNGDNKLLILPADGLQLGIVEELDDEANYDPYPMVIGDPLAKIPDGLIWQSPILFEEKSRSVDSVTLKLVFENEITATLEIKRNAKGNFRLFLIPDNQGTQVAYFRLRATVNSAEGFYGLGAYEDHVNHRGFIRAMQLEAEPLESAYNEAHVPVPIIIGTNGWGLFAECPYPGVFDVATQSEDSLEITFGTGTGSNNGFQFHLFAADHPLDVTKHYYDITGYPKLPAPWALGPLVWRDENDNQDQFENDLQTMRDLDLACSGVWIDRPYASGVNGFDFNADKFPEPTRMIQLAHDLGYRMGLWHTPYTSGDNESSERTRELHDYAVENGYYPPVTGLILNKWGKPIDLTNPDAYDWWQNLIHEYTDMGIEGFKLDYGEDVVPGIFGARNKWLFYDGSDERTMHSLFQRFYHQVYAETMPDDGGFLICRGGTYGDQVNVNVIWPGDLDADMTLHGEEVDDGNGGTYKAVGGLPASMIYGLTLGPSGFPFYGSDTGGYRHSPPDKQTFTRWFQQTALSTVMQIGTSSDDVAWEYNNENQFDDEMLGWYREFVRLHLRLFPYQWTYAKNIATDGRPIQRSLGLAYPELEEHPWDIYMFGDYLLVAPVVIRDEMEKTVIFPEGKWIDWFNGEIFEGNQTVTVPAPLNKLPLFIMAGGIVPLLRPTIDTTARTATPGEIESYANDPGVLYPVVAVGGESYFTLFDGTILSQQETEHGFVLTYTGGEKFSQGALYTVIGAGNEPPSSVRIDDSDATYAESLSGLENMETGWTYSEERGGSIMVKVGSGEHSIDVIR